MSDPVNLYDSHYGKTEDDVYRGVRAETFGEDIGQTSWLTVKECDDLCSWVELTPRSRVLEIACGSGGVSVRIAERFGASVTGVDLNEAAVAEASDRAKRRGVQDRTEFRAADADRPLPLPDGSFDLVFCNDAINHLQDRRRVLMDWHRLLRAGGHCLYTDPVVVSGFLSKAEIAARSSIGFFLFGPTGANERCLDEAGFALRRSADLTESMSAASHRWHEARLARREPLCVLEGEKTYDDLQRFLMAVHTLASERRLSRLAFLGEKMVGSTPAGGGGKAAGRTDHRGS